MKKKNIFIIILMLILACAIPVLTSTFVNADIEYNKFSETHSYTTAICDETNYCQDNIVKCNKDQVISINPITGAAVQFSVDWQDPRDKETRNSFCE